MQMHSPRGIAFLKPAALAHDTIRSGFSLRHGGVSNGVYHALNLGLSGGDARDSVIENRRRLFEKAGLPPDRLAIAGQVHGEKIAQVSEPGLFPGFDALVTRTPDLVLCITAADCAVLLLADPEARVVAACHSGWRGTVAEIARRTVEAMLDQGSQTRQIRAYISPSISTDHFEVGPEVAAEFPDQYVIERSDWTRPHVDLKHAIMDQLIQTGIDASSIEMSARCTFSETHDFFSYRAENGATGRMMGFISLLGEDAPPIDRASR